MYSTHSLLGKLQDAAKPYTLETPWFGPSPTGGMLTKGWLAFLVLESENPASHTGLQYPPKLLVTGLLLPKQKANRAVY